MLERYPPDVVLLPAAIGARQDGQDRQDPQDTLSDRMCGCGAEDGVRAHLAVLR